MPASIRPRGTCCCRPLLIYEQRKAREAQKHLAKLRDPFTGRMLSSIEHRKPDLRAGDYWTDNNVGTGDDRHNRSTIVLSNARPARILSAWHPMGI